ncbi:MAG: hypothetical protein HYW27_04115 [Candidatus Aenigmarchaeota archaeon]|nr:hypothetical protein [Candidatus Aenigmarchaeota archaeon]
MVDDVQLPFPLNLIVILMKYEVMLLIFIVFSATAFAETGGQINTTTFNVSVITGLFGHTVDFCNANYECFGYSCFLDWDNTGGGGRAGWCNLSSITSCYHNGTVTATGASACDTSTSYRTCSSGAWGSSTSCASNNTCSNGACSSSSSSSSSSGGSSSTSNTTNLNQAMKVLSTVTDFSIVQGNRTLKTIVVKNSGNRTLFNVSVNITGIETGWLSIGPNKVNITVGANATFGIEFIIPPNGSAKIYDVTIDIMTSNSSVKDSSTFKLTVVPTEETVQREILPSYNEASARLAELEKKVEGLKETCTEVKVLESNRDEIRAKITAIESAIQEKDYSKANTIIGEAKAALDELNQKILNTTPSSCSGAELPVLYVAGAGAVVGAIAILAYLFWPQKPETGYHPEKGWTPPKHKAVKKKKKDDEFLYDFKRRKK